MLFISDVHGAFDSLRRIAGMGELVVILGDLANLTDYRSGEGAVADVLGLEFARQTAAARAEGDYRGMRTLWAEHVGSDIDGVRRRIGDAISIQYQEVTKALKGGRGLVIHGNVDRPRQLVEALPEGFRYVHGEALDVEGMRFGFVGGGVETPLQAEGEVSDEEMARLLQAIGPVDVLCTHVPPAVPALRRDVITGREERGSEPIREYLVSNQPRYHIYGDIHQAQATTWRLGATRCVNAGYFRATGRYVRIDAAMVHTGRIG